RHLRHISAIFNLSRIVAQFRSITCGINTNRTKRHSSSVSVIPFRKATSNIYQRKTDFNAEVELPPELNVVFGDVTHIKSRTNCNERQTKVASHAHNQVGRIRWNVVGGG